jgi:hypothetical protein
METSAMSNLLRFLLPFMLLSLAGCASDPVSLKIGSGLPPDKLAYYSDHFEKFRDDLWDKSALLYQDSQLENFQLADMIYRDGKLIITTERDCFSKGSLNSKFALQGDFDIQLDCRFNPLHGSHQMDQILWFGVVNKRPGDAVNIDFVSIGVSQDFLFSRAKNTVGRSPQIEAIQAFNGSFRIVRAGRTVTTFYRQKVAPWKQLGSFPFSTSNLIVGFLLQNFTAKTSYLKSALPFSAEFFEFRINAAQGIVEEEI